MSQLSGLHLRATNVCLFVLIIISKQINLFIYLFVCLFRLVFYSLVYFFVGILIDICLFKKRGLEVIPNLDFWTETPFLFRVSVFIIGTNTCLLVCLLDRTGFYSVRVCVTPL